MEEEAEIVYSQRENGTPREGPSKSNEQRSYELTGTEAASAGLTWICTGLLKYLL